MNHTSIVASEALIVSIAVRYLVNKYKKVRIIRGDGKVVFSFQADEANDTKAFTDTIERLISTIVKELTGNVKIKLDENIGLVDFSNIGKCGSTSIGFGEFMRRCEADVEVSDLPNISTVGSLLEVLYTEAAVDFNSVITVKDFPACMNGEGSKDSYRYDYVVKNSVIVRGYSNTKLHLIMHEEGDKNGGSNNNNNNNDDDDGELFEKEISPDRSPNRLTSSQNITGDTAKILLEANALAHLLVAFSSAPLEENLPKLWRHKTFSLEESTEVLRSVYHKLVDFWRSSNYTETVKVNAISLLQIVSGDVRAFVSEQITIESSDISGPWRMNLSILERCLDLCMAWKGYLNDLIEKDWHQWDGGHYHDDSLEHFIERLRGVVRTRTLYEIGRQLMNTPQVLYEINPEQVFSGCSLLDTKITPCREWRRKCEEFEKKFELVESTLSGRIKGILSQKEGDSKSRIMQQYNVLLCRENVRLVIADDLSALFKNFRDRLFSVQAKFRGKKDSVPLEDSLVVLMMTRHCMTEIGATVDKSRSIFSPHSEEYTAIDATADKILSELIDTEKESISLWIAVIEKRCSAIKPSDTAVTIEVNSDRDIITAVISPVLLALYDNVRAVRSSLSGPKLVARIEFSSSATRTLDDIDRTRKHVMRLSRLMSGFSSVVEKILPFNKVMLVDSVNNTIGTVIPKGMTSVTIPLSEGPELETKANRLQQAAERLSAENRSLRRAHCDLSESVLGLFNVDLLRNPELWKVTLKEMRDVFDSFEKLQSSPENLYEWRRHWDFQLYKVLEHQYQKGLENLNENVQEFKVDMIFKQGHVQFKPGYEALREAYYTKIREFIGIPQRFKGVGNSDFFATMPSRNSGAISAVHQKAMELFGKVNRVRRVFYDFVVIGVCGTNGAPDLDFLVDKLVITKEDWEDGYRMIKERTKKLSLMEDIVQVDCITISTTPIKASISDHLHKLEESLTISLRKAMQVRLAKIDDFVIYASNVIERQPTSLDEVGKANQAYLKFKEVVPEHQKHLNEIDAMNTMVRLHGGAPFEMSVARSRWEHLMDAMSCHNKQIDQSVGKMRVSVDNMIAKFMRDLTRFSNNWDKHKPAGMNSFKNRQEFIDKGLNYVKNQVAELQDYIANGKELTDKCEYFRIPDPDFSLLESTKKDIETHDQMWSLYEQFEEQLDLIRNEDWLTFRSRSYVFEDFLHEWTEKIEKLNKENGENIVTNYLVKMINVWSNSTPMLRFVNGDGYLPEHWNELFRILELEKGMTSDKMTFGHILASHEKMLSNEKELKYLHGRAQGEVQIRDAMQDLRTWAMEASFTLITPQDSTVKIKLITEWKDAMTQVSDNQALINSIKDSPYFPRFADEALGWEQKLANVSEYLILLNSIQRKWSYLEPLFGRGALPHEKPRFTRVDKEFVAILRDVETDPRIMTLAQQDLSEKLKNILEQIDRCQKALNEFLEQKRDKFPRFYFISDEDLLEILGQSKNPTVIQTHLKKLFAGINSVKFDESKVAIVEMISADKEVVPLSKKISITDNNVEDWLIRLDDCMRVTLRELLGRCTGEKDATSIKVVESYPSQVLQVTEQVFFARDIEAAIPSGKVKDVLEKLRKKLHTLTGFNLHEKPVTELKTKALILDVIHNIEVAEMLIQKNVTNSKSWWWQKQLRYYTETGDISNGGTECKIRMYDTEFNYTFEYQGNAAKLVHTPLTDKCYLVLTKGMHLGYGGNPYGPAGTGKTESVKALGSAMGRQVLVFNCDEGIDFKAMGRIFVGIVKCGAWGCFDEFNRLKIDQLSAISQMIQAIQESLKNNEPTCSLLGRAIDVNANSGIFVTMNPAGKGYGGRTKLPDNLKQLFRAVAMSIPDNELITATMLQSEGFLYANQLSKKLVDMYRLSKQLMSAQQHYDWGLRPLKAVLRLGGSLVQEFRHANPDTKTTEVQEAEFMVQSLRINTISKLTFDDGRLFNGLISDIFPGIAIKEISYKELESAVEAAAKSLGLQHNKSQVIKVLQLYEAMNQRMGVVLVGPSGSGKSTLLNLLRKALQIMNIDVPLHVVNPKAIPRQQLLGHMDSDTREWFDGVLSAAARKVVKEPAEVRSWIFCDGDIDPEWVESLNSVLDDNKLLTMPNGVRIQFGNNVNFVFETHSLEFASPATVSRMGIIFLSEKDVEPELAVASFMARLPEERQSAGGWVKEYLYKAINILIDMDNLGVATTRMGLLNTALTHVISAQTKLDFACSLIRSLGMTLSPESQNEYASKIFELCGEEPNDTSRPLNTYYNRQKKHSASFNNKNISKSMDYTELQSQEKPMIRTAEIERISAILEPLVKDQSCKPFFLVGPEGCGKSMILQNCFKGEKGVRVAMIHCSAQTNTQHVIQKITQHCAVFSTNAGKVLRPKEGDRLVLALKDINLPKPDKYGTVQLHSFIQQLLLYRGYYDSDLEWVGIEKIQIVGSLNPIVSAGRFPVAPRLLAITNIINIPYPAKEALNQVYTCFFGAMLKSPKFADGPQYENGLQLAQCCTNVFEKIQKTFKGEDYAHCILSPRDITTWVCAIQNYSIEGSNLANVMAYEASRIFGDRLSRHEDRVKAEKIFAEQMVMIGYGGSNNSDSLKEKAIYASWAHQWPTGSSSVKLLQLTTYADSEKEIRNALLKYSREYCDLSVTLVPEVLTWIPRIDRVLSRPGGHLLLVGRAGSGRRAAVTIASYMIRIAVVSINMTKDYSLKAFRSDLRNVFQRVAVQNERVTLLLEDHNLTQVSFLEMINSLISSGEVPGLYSPEELEQMMGPLRDEASSEGFIGNLHSFFLQRINKNLHVCLIMDATNELFAPRCQANPALLTCCSVLWIGAWSSEATKSICKYVLRKIIKEIESDSTFKGFTLHREMLSIHESQGDRATPAHFRTLMATYANIYDLKGKAGNEAMQRLEAGLSKLKEAEADVDKIKHDVGKKKIEMEGKQEEADNALTEIQKNIEDSAEQRAEVQELQVKLKKETKDIEVKSASVKAELDTIQPILDEAKRAVGGIKSESLNEIRSLRNPPEPVRDVLEGVLAILGIEDSTWNGMKKFLGERGVKERILDFDARTIKNKTRESVAKLLKQKAASFKYETIVRASVAAAPMAAWVSANIDYAVVLERIDPLTKQLNELEATRAHEEERLNTLTSKLEKIDSNVEKLRKDFSKMCKEAERLKDKLEHAEKQLETAKNLLEKLKGEKSRWSKDVVNIREKNKQMPCRALLCSAFLTYLTKEPEEVRVRFMGKWAEKLGFTDTIPSVTDFMRNESQLLQFKSEGLPADSLSQENAIAILDSLQTPLIVDPANQAIEWLKCNLNNRGITVETSSIADDRFPHTLELAIRFGKTLLVTEIDQIEPMLFPVLRRDLISQGPKQVVQLGNKAIDWQHSFKIFLFSRSNDMVLSPDCQSLINEVNFSVTRSGLESQLLGITIQSENPELETQKVELLKEEEHLNIQLAKLEESLLSDLANSHGDLLHNAQLIESLNQVKAQAQAIGESLEKSKELQIELDQKRDVYRPYANKGSIMFFLIQDMDVLNRMYQFSLVDFLNIFKKALSEYEGDNNINVKINLLSLTMAQKAFLHVSRGLFKIHRVEFAMHVCHKFFPSDFKVTHWGAFLETSIGDEKEAAVRLPSWAQPSALLPFASVCALSDSEELITKWDLGNKGFWEQWVRDPTPEVLLYKRSDLTDMDKLLIISCFRRDRLVNTMTRIAQERLQIHALVEVSTVESLVSESSCDVPILLITSSGADPSMEVQEIAYKRIGRNNFTQLGLGGGQTDEAMLQLRRCAASGDWLFLKNLHLVLDWVSILEKEIVSMPRPHESFRLFLTTEAHDLFPTVLLKSCIKMTIEAPPGVQQNLLRSYSNWTVEFLSNINIEQSQILFGLAWFHAIIQERRNFIPQGWVKYYEFSQADLKSAADILLSLSSNNNNNNNGEVDWIAVQGLFESAIYGGRLDNDSDIRILSVFLRQTFNKNKLINCTEKLSGIINIPKTRKHEEIIEYIFTNVPDCDSPMCFGLPPNADSAVQESTGSLHINNIRQIETLIRTLSTSNTKALKVIIQPIMEIWESVGVKITRASPKILSKSNNNNNNNNNNENNNNLDPLHIFFISEIELLSNIITTITNIFSDLSKITNGIIIPNEEQKEIIKTLGNGIVPNEWLDLMNGQTSLLLWLQLLQYKYNTMYDSYEKHSSSTLLNNNNNNNNNIKLTNFLRPHTFLNAYRQYTARKEKKQMTNLSLIAIPTNSQYLKLSSSEKIIINNDDLYIQGAIVSDNGIINNLDNNSPSFVKFVNVSLCWDDINNINNNNNNIYFQLPVYLDSSRELLLFEVMILVASIEEKEKWILSGAAVFLK